MPDQSLVYLDQDQCRRFDVGYFSAALFSVRADVLLASKGRDGYDDRHFEILGPMRAKIVRLERFDNDPNGPGWFRIVK